MSFSGVWYDPASEGCGFVFVENSFGSQVFYFGHTADGAQFWLTGYGNPIAGISLAHTAGSGWPTQHRTHEPAVGTLKLGSALDEGRIEIEVELDSSLVYPDVDFSPAPEDRVSHTFRCQRIELAGPM
jgi:hypothetical protein